MKLFILKLVCVIASLLLLVSQYSKRSHDNEAICVSFAIIGIVTAALM